jgi:hypothetical protein
MWLGAEARPMVQCCNASRWWAVGDRCVSMRWQTTSSVAGRHGGAVELADVDTVGKNIEIDMHFVHEKVSLGPDRVLHVLSSHLFADMMTKGLFVQLFTAFQSSLCVCDSTVVTVGEC